MKESNEADRSKDEKKTEPRKSKLKLKHRSGSPQANVDEGEEDSWSEDEKKTKCGKSKLKSIF